MKRLVCAAVILALILGTFGCASMSGRDKGVAIGAATGAVLGGIIGKQSDNTAVGAILGAAVGGVAGGVIGNYMDKQAEEMEQDLEGAKVERVGEGIKVTFPDKAPFIKASEKVYDKWFKTHPRWKAWYDEIQFLDPDARMPEASMKK